MASGVFGSPLDLHQHLMGLEVMFATGSLRTLPGPRIGPTEESTYRSFRILSGHLK